MKKNTVLILSFILIIINSCQKDKFERYKEGTFYIPGNQKNVDKYIVVRKENKQVIYKNNLEDPNPEYQLIEWFDHRTYRLTFDSNMMELTEDQKYRNDNGGYLVEDLMIEGECLLFKSTTEFEGEKSDYTSKLCIN